MGAFIGIQEISEVGTFELNHVNGELAVLVVEALDAHQQTVRACEDTFRIDVDVFKIRRGHLGQACVPAHRFYQTAFDGESLHG